MAEFFGGLFALASMVVFLASVVALIRPIAKIGLPTRKRAGLALVGSFVLAMIGGSLLPKPEGTAAVAAKTATKPAPAKAKEEPTVNLTAETKVVWTQITDKVQGCDTASKRVAEAFEKTRDVYELYTIVTGAQARCKDSWQGLNDVDPPPSAKGAHRVGFKDAIENCSTAYFMKFDAYEKMAKVLDGDSRPSAVSTAKESMESANTAQFGCVAGFFVAAEKAGVPMSEIGDKKAG